MSTTLNAEKVQRGERAKAESTELAPGIWSTPGVCGGDACVGESRITVDGLVELRQLGCDDAKLLVAYPGLTQSDLNNAWEYARLHADEIQAQIDENNRDE